MVGLSWLFSIYLKEPNSFFKLWEHIENSSYCRKRELPQTFPKNLGLWNQCAWCNVRVDTFIIATACLFIKLVTCAGKHDPPFVHRLLQVACWIAALTMFPTYPFVHPLFLFMWFLPFRVLFSCLCTPVLSSPLISQHRKEFSISSLHLSFISQVSLSASFSPIRGLFLRHVENTGTRVDLAFLRTGLLGNSPSSLFTFNTVRLLLNCPISSCLFLNNYNPQIVS